MKIKAELWDKMQYMFRNFYDRMVHAYMVYDGIVDLKILKTVLISFTEMEKYYILNLLNTLLSHIEVCPYSIDDILTVKESTNIEKDVNDF